MKVLFSYSPYCSRSGLKGNGVLAEGVCVHKSTSATPFTPGPHKWSGVNGVQNVL